MCHKDLKNYAYVDVRPTLKSNPLIDKGGGGGGKRLPSLPCTKTTTASDNKEYAWER